MIKTLRSDESGGKAEIATSRSDFVEGVLREMRDNREVNRSLADSLARLVPVQEAFIKFLQEWKEDEKFIAREARMLKEIEIATLKQKLQTDKENFDREREEERERERQRPPRR
jgi:uncharacterized damage-inducible protein DinB